MRVDFLSRAYGDRRIRRAGLTTIASGMNLVVKLLCGMLVMRMVNAHAGPEAFGLIITVAGVALWLLAFDLGLGPAVKNQLIPIIAADADAKKLAEVIAQAFLASFLLVLAGIVALLIAVPMVPFTVFFGRMEPATMAWFPSFFLLSCASVLLALPGIIAKSIASSFQEEYRLWASTIAGPLLSLLLTWYAIHAGLGMALVGAAALIGQALGSWLTLAQVIAQRPHLFRRTADVRGVIALLSDGLPFMVVQCASAIIFQSGVFIVNLLHGATAAGIFAIHVQIFGYIAALTGMVIQPYWSAFGDARARNDFAWLRTTLRRMLLMLTSAATMMVAGIFAIGWWLVPTLSAGNSHWDVKLALALAVNIVLISCGNVFAVFLASAKVVTGPAYVIVCQALAVIILGTLLGIFWGPAGVTCGAVIAYLITSGWYTPYKTMQTLRGVR
jgi:O-antigen/teichoic acid export membrane protein